MARENADQPRRSVRVPLHSVDVAMRVELRASYEVEADKYFWLRDTVDGSEVDGLRRQVASSSRRCRLVRS
jgi:hypothetical protein